MNVKREILSEVSYLKFELPEYLFRTIKDEVEEMQQNNFAYSRPYNQQLAGAIQHEYVLYKCASSIDSFFSQDAFKFNNKRLRLLSLKEIGTGNRIPSLWVNFQKRYEFNPIHKHDGMFSFVIWIKIPYDLEEEKKITEHAKRSC